MPRKSKRNKKNVIVKLRLYEILLDPRFSDANSQDSEPVRKKCIDIDGNFLWCAVRRASDIYSDMVDTLNYARIIARELESDFEFWNWSGKYLIFGLRAEAYRTLRLSELIDHIGTIKLLPNGFIEDLVVLDPARVLAVGAFVRAASFDWQLFNRQLSEIAQSVSTARV
jgi:hypothetical protein